MYQIGLFSKMNQVTIKTLHHYDTIGLLRPYKIDAETGYRYYTLGQSYTLHRINALKQIGFGLEDIKAIIEGKAKENYLLKKKAQLLAEIAETTRKLAEVEYYLSEKEDFYCKDYEVLVKEIPEAIVVTKRLILNSHKDLFHVMPEMGEAMAELGCVCAMPEYCFNLYHDGEYKQHNIDVEICEAVTALQPDAKGLSFKRVPQIKKAACLFHKGAYESLPTAYLALTSWMESNGYEPADIPRESYIDGIWNKDTENEWLTEIQFPIQEIAAITAERNTP